jgi:hypothetical protein
MGIIHMGNISKCAPHIISFTSLAGLKSIYAQSCFALASDF